MRAWLCIICGHKNRSIEFLREGMFCSKCESNWRVRATALGVLIGVGAPLVPFPEVRSNWWWRGVGTSDHMTLAGALGTKFSYTNSYYHQFPRVDLLNIAEDQRHQFGFVICSDVLEHVPPPVDRALSGVGHLLADHGFAVLSVPIGSRDGSTDEYYPDLVSWKEFEDRVEWVDFAGFTHVDSDPEFHGGPGQTLAFRTWSTGNFCKRVIDSGFKAISEIPPHPELGVPAIENAGVFIAHIDR